MSVSLLIAAVAAGLFLFIILVKLIFIILDLRRVVPTNQVHIVQRAKQTISYGKDTENGNTYYEFPSWIPILGITKVVLPVSVFIAAAFVPERYRLLAKIQLTQPGKGRNPGKMRNVLADRPCGSSSVNLFIDPSIWCLSLQQYQVHARFILLDRVTGYRSQYQQHSFIVSLS